ncbi:MAG: CTP synthase, partial [Chloroflexi bacterium]|nr:CTP synthase [Chloroflexota bacterium]
HAGVHLGRQVALAWINAEEVTAESAAALLGPASGIVVPGGFGRRGIEGMIAAARYAREHDVPYLGLCLGMQVMVIELARHVLGEAAANSTEFDPATPYPVIDLLPEQRHLAEKGGTMRLGLWPCALVPGTHAAAAYGLPLVHERHRHRYELNNEFRERLAAAGLVYSGLSPDGRLVEISELADHSWMLGCQFHPELKSRPNRPHPLFRAFVEAASQHLPHSDQRPMPPPQMLV